MAALLVFILFAVSSVNAQAPTGCSYDSTEILYTCNARSWSLPLAYSGFTSGQPQRLLLIELSGTVASNTFSGFSSINTGTFDTRYTPSLHMRCSASSQLILDGAAFADFAYIDEVKIIDCDILSLPADVFTNFGDVNLFHITGGSITNMQPDAFKGLNVVKMAQYDNPLGEFGLINAQLVSGSLAFGALYNMANVERVRIESAHLLVTQVDMFQALTKMKYLSLNNNLFTKLDNNMFSKTAALSQVDVYGIGWYCSCDYLWFLDWAMENNLTVRGDVVCNEPLSVQRTRGASYYKENCVTIDVCDGNIGFAMGGSCMTLLDILYYSFTLITVIVSTVAFGMTVHSYRKVRAMQQANPQKGRKMSGSTWNKVADDGPPTGRQNAPAAAAKTHQPPKRNNSQDVIRSPREGPNIHSFDF